MAACSCSRAAVGNVGKFTFSKLCGRQVLSSSCGTYSRLLVVNRAVNGPVRLLSSGYLHNTRRYTDETPSESEDDHKEELLSNLRRKHRQHSTSQQHNVQDGVGFKDFPINDGLVNQLERLGYDEPFEIQAKTLPHTLAGRDVIGRAVTGSGKTLAFSIPIIQKVSQQERRRGSRSPKAIVISPTRELCQQIYRSIQELDPRIRCVALYGGDSYIRQESAMRRGIDVVCATPGRLNDHLQRGNLDLQEMSFLCLDEADELLTPNFKVQIEDVLASSPQGRQVMLFSATMPPDIVHLTKRYMSDPVFIDIAGSQKLVAPESVKHMAIRCSPANYHLVTKALINEHQPERCIVFMETKVKTTHTAMVLRRLGLRADALNSDLTQRKREQILAAFRLGKLNVLVATDVAARGLDIPEVDLVIQAGPPRNGVDFYIHRSGRTGRAGRDGLAVTLHSGNDEDWYIMKQIQRLVKLEHAPPPNQEQLESQVVKNIIKSIQNVKEDVVEKYMPEVDKLDLTDDEGRELLAAAIAILTRVKMGGDHSSSSSGHEHYGHHRPYKHDGFGKEFPKHRGQGFSSHQRFNRDSSHGFYSRTNRSASNPSYRGLMEDD